MKINLQIWFRDLHYFKEMSRQQTKTDKETSLQGGEHSHNQVM